MKLKSLLILAFLVVTLLPAVIVSGLFYYSGYNLSKESYVKNLTESIHVQSDYISQTMENNRLADLNFVNDNFQISGSAAEGGTENGGWRQEAGKSYLESSEDKIAVCMMLGSRDETFYTIGEKTEIEAVRSQLPDLSRLTEQIVLEIVMDDGNYNIGVVTPARNKEGEYLGSLVSVYDRSYIFKIIGSYYKIADTATYICRENGDVINFNKFSDEKQNEAIGKALVALTLHGDGEIDMHMEGAKVSGYYKNIQNTPWYLVGFIDNRLVYSFTNRFVVVYLFIIAGVVVLDMLLAVYFSGKVVKPLNDLIKVMDEYKNSLNINETRYQEKDGYFETRYLRTKFLGLMRTIFLAQHNYKGIYQLYQSSDMGDINIDIDVEKQIATSNKDKFQKLMDEVEVAEDDCIVERFTKCFCEKDRATLMNIMENLRDGHLSVTREAEVYTPYLGQKWFHSLIVPMYEEEKLSRMFIQLRDISSFRKQEYESIEQARRDSLTGLLNRAGFTAGVERELSRKSGEDPQGLMFIDMNYFKMVNDNLGHSAGDELLCSVGKTIAEIVGDSGVVSRFGGDEFAVFLPHTDEVHIEELKQKINKGLVYPYQTDKISFAVSASIGVTLWTQSTPDTLGKMLELADASMYQAKREFKDGTRGQL